jgi:hypothetical protein
METLPKTAGVPRRKEGNKACRGIRKESRGSLPLKWLWKSRFFVRENFKGDKKP